MSDGEASNRETQRNLRRVDGRPCIVVDGHHLTSIYSETFPRRMHERNCQMAEAGVQVFMLIVRGDLGKQFHTSWFWRDDGVYGDDSDRDDGLSLEDQAREILAGRPDAYFMVRWGSRVPGGWGGKHPDHLQASELGRREEASYASRLAAEGRAELARRIVRYVQSRPWADRVVGYLPFGQDEGTHHLCVYDAMFDQSPVMRDEFRAFLRQRYGTDSELRAAWGDDAAGLDAATVPTDSEWQTARERWQHWPEPAQTARYRDYFLAMRGMLIFQRRTEMGAVKEVCGDRAFVGTDAFKQPMFGWLHNDAFDGAAYGMPWRNMLLASGSIDVAEMLDAPEMDAIVTPADYTARSVGGGWDSEGIADSMVLRGKTILVEDDARSWATEERDTQGAWRTESECRAGLRRNLVLGASRGHIPYWMNVGGGYFDDPGVLKVVAGQVPLRQRLLSAPWSDTEHAVAMILDDTSPLDEDFTAGFQNLAVLRQRNDHLCLTGLPWRIHLLSDVARDDFPAYRAYLFPNLFRLDAERVALLRRKLMRDGRVLVFGPGTGISDGATLGADAASDLLGFPLELVRKESARRVLVYGGSHPALGDMRAPESFGDSFPYGPILQPAERVLPEGVTELGKVSAWWYCNRAGLVLKEFGRGAMASGTGGGRGEGDYAVVFSMATPIPASVLRSLALYGGCTPWSDLGDVVAASGNMVAVHSIRPGERTIRPPSASPVTDAVSGDPVATDGAGFRATLEAGDTRVFMLG